MAPALATVRGRFHRAIPAGRVAQVLDVPGPQSAGRYHRPGEAALYLTREAEWAVIALSVYASEDGITRVVVPVEVSAARVLDQRDMAAMASVGIDPARSAESWRGALAKGREPGSWHAADRARSLGADGIIDPSRNIAGGWHLVLFRWNQPGAPQVRVTGDA